MAKNKTLQQMCHQNYACESCLALQTLHGIIFHIVARNKIFTHSKSVFAQHTDSGKNGCNQSIQILAEIICVVYKIKTVMENFLFSMYYGKKKKKKKIMIFFTKRPFQHLN